MPGERRHVLGQVGRCLAALVVLAFVAFPLYGVALTSVQRERDVRSPDLNLIPRYLDWSHYQEVLSPGHIVPIGEAMRNSFVVSMTAALVAVALAVPATYALNRLRMPARRLVLAGMVSVYVLPTRWGGGLAPIGARNHHRHHHERHRCPARRHPIRRPAAA
jgi:ABC-type glycerol-3-phosphate transport system permease component